MSPVPTISRQAVIALRIPVITLVLAATAIPVELRSHATLGFNIERYDVAENIAGFAVVGIVLGDLGLLRAIVVGALISIFAEASQFFMMHRDPSAIDVVSNVIGTMLGAVISTRWGFHSPELRIGKWKAALAAAMALVLIGEVWASSGDALNARGVASPGILEAYWKFDEGSGRVALDSSGHGLHGNFSNQPRRVAGVIGGAVSFDGSKDYIDAGHSTSFRLTGSMTITAWINSSSFPKDDAAIVSQFQNKRGYQLDTTVDKRLRGIGFKLTNSCGDLMTRYGATPLGIGTWYHVAGVYDSGARTMDVYLNGKLDNGLPVGKVTGRQRSSRSAVYIGRRSDLEGFEFAGAIDDVRIYSFPLTKEEVAAAMRGEVIQHTTGGGKADLPRNGGDAACGASSEYEDSKIPAMAATLGVLVAIACVGFWPSGATFPCFVMSLAAGLLLLPFMSTTLPLLSRWTVPLVSLAGGASIAVSRRR
jgi:uncharacterized membrane protein YeaQ/YmgE (transglycosylase-associated protein family)